MDTVEYANIAQMEKVHWYNIGKREFVRRWILDTQAPQKDDLLLDCGAGTGLFAEEMQAYCQIRTLDAFEPALEMQRKRFSPEQVIEMTGKEVPLPDNSLNYLTALDVLEHIKDDAAAVRDWHRLLKPNGLAVITVPASMALWSDWDVAMHHFRRYDRKGLLAVFPQSHWEILHVNYTNTLAFLPAWLIRKLRSHKPVKAEEQANRAEYRIPPPWLNALLRWIFVTTAMWRVPMPFGLSLLLVARRKEV